MNEVLPWPNSPGYDDNLKILDLSCGSGIFLVEAYRRLIERWRMNNPTENKVPVEVLRKLLTRSIFGVDEEEEAIKVAAFSLYLALLDCLEPKTIWERVTFPKLLYKRTFTDNENGSNLFVTDSFKEGLPYETHRYDIVVGNPPWKRELPQTAKDYCKKHEHAISEEKAHAFLWRASDLCPTGQIAMLAPSKILFNTENPDKEFRRTFFKNNYVQTVVNFSALRRTGLFPSAVGPACVLFFSPKWHKEEQKTILYCTPKPSKSKGTIPRVFIDSSELKHLPREQCINEDEIWKIATEEVTELSRQIVPWLPNEAL